MLNWVPSNHKSLIRPALNFFFLFNTGYQTKIQFIFCTKKKRKKKTFNWIKNKIGYGGWWTILKKRGHSLNFPLRYMTQCHRSIEGHCVGVGHSTTKNHVYFPAHNSSAYWYCIASLIDHLDEEWTKKSNALKREHSFEPQPQYTTTKSIKFNNIKNCMLSMPL